MTQEEPQQRPDVIRCDKCHQKPTLHRESFNTLSVRCACDKQRSIKVSRALPEGW